MVAKKSKSKAKGDKVYWPAWRYGPNGQSAIFDKESEVPEGWTDNPNDHKPGGAASAEEQKTPGRQPRDGVEDDSFYEAMGETELRQQLDAKGIAYHPRAGKPKLIQLLKTGKQKPGAKAEA